MSFERKTSKLAELTTSSGRLFHFSTILGKKEYLYASTLQGCVSSLQEWPRVLKLAALEKYGGSKGMDTRSFLDLKTVTCLAWLRRCSKDGQDSLSIKFETLVWREKSLKTKRAAFLWTDSSLSFSFFVWGVYSWTKFDGRSNKSFVGMLFYCPRGTV